ncbi:MAG: hypothetical protein KKE20_04875, partial [Nanoarchaeota archaeon]|nr:hypothetical protein [Nanoarchaeota archaeon]
QTMEKCKDQCYKVSTWCDRDQLYACVQEPGCMKQFLVKACDDGSTCENSLFCKGDDGSREGVMTMDQLMQAAPSVKGEAGDEFNLEYLGSKMDCVVTEIIRGTAVILCE